MRKPRSAGKRFNQHRRRKLHAGESLLDARLRERFGLTRRQAEVAMALAGGLSYAEIAERDHVSYHTVHTHVKAIHRKALVHSSRRLASLIHSMLSEEP